MRSETGVIFTTVTGFVCLYFCLPSVDELYVTHQKGARILETRIREMIDYHLSDHYKF